MLVNYSPDGYAYFGFFGYVKGPFDKWGCFLPSELQTARSPSGLPIERDLYLEPVPVSWVVGDNEGGSSDVAAPAILFKPLWSQLGTPLK